MDRPLIEVIDDESWLKSDIFNYFCIALILIFLPRSKDDVE